MGDIFERIHKCLRLDKLDCALNELVDLKTYKIKKPFDKDENHAWYVVGDIYFRKRMWGKALRAFKRAVLNWPEDVDAYVALADCYFEKNELGAARDALLKAQTISPSNSKVAYNLANIYFDLRQYEKAILLYTSITKDDDPDIFEKAQKNKSLSEERLHGLTIK